MKSQDLRIGNLVYTDYEGTLEVININSEGFDYIDCKKPTFKSIGRYSIDSIKPIVLTEEWLLKFGFIAFDDKTFIHDSLRYSDKFKFREDGVLAYVSSEVYITDLKYVHQLQNLYFALTGEELTYGGNKWK